MSETNAPARLEGYVRSDEGRVQAEKSPLPMLRVTANGHGKFWLLYHAVTGGDQDDSENVKWFEIWYGGIVPFNREPTFGQWKIRVEGSGLEKLCYYLGKAVIGDLYLGKQKGFEQTTHVASITLDVLPVRELG